MNKLSIAGLLLAATPAFTSVAALGNDEPQQRTPHNQADKNRYIIVFSNKTQIQKQPDVNGHTANTMSVFTNGRFSATNANQQLSSLGANVIHALPAISGMSAQLTASQLTQLKNNPQVAFVEPWKKGVKSFDH
jgi:hypothetical protein